MDFGTFHKLAKDGKCAEYQRSIMDTFYRENTGLFTGIIVEAGCGYSISYKTEPDRCRYIGVDLSLPELLRNSRVDFRICADVGYLPFGDSSVDLIICNDLVEHLYYPEKFFAEASRCLRQSGGFIISTVNLYGGVVPLVAKLLPRTASEFIWRLWKNSSMPTYPFVYKANTSKAIHHLASNNGFVVESMLYINSVHHWFHGMPFLATILYACGQSACKVRADLLQGSMIAVLRKYHE